MSYGPVKVFTGSIASGASTLTSLDISKSWSRVFCEISSFSTHAELKVFGSADGTNFKQIWERVKTAPVQYQELTIGSQVGDGIFGIDAICQYFQFRASATIDNGGTIKLICID